MNMEVDFLPDTGISAWVRESTPSL